MPILDLQKRARELGRIRIGQVVPTTKRDGTAGTRPEKLDRFRLTSASKPLLEKVAALYGGEVREWTPQGGGATAWEVITTSTRLPIMVPPQPITQWYEFWTAGGCKHRCDGHTNVLTDELCDPEDFGHQEAIKRPTTRLNVVLRDVEGIGVWRLETHGINAAMELPDAATFLAQAGGYVNGWVSLEQRTSKAEVPDRQNGGMKIETRRFMVPIIEIDVTPAELMAGKGRVATPTLEGPVARPQIEAPADPFTALFEQLAAATTFEQCQAVWAVALEAKLVGPESAQTQRREEFFEAVRTRGAEMSTPAPADPAPDADGAYEADVVESQGDPDVAWQQLLAAAGELDMTLADVEDGFAQFTQGITAADGTAAQFDAYRASLVSEQVPA